MERGVVDVGRGRPGGVEGVVVAAEPAAVEPGAGGELGTVLVGEAAYPHPGAFGEVAGCGVRHPATVTSPPVTSPPVEERPGQEPATGSPRMR